MIDSKYNDGQRVTFSTLVDPDLPEVYVNLENDQKEPFLYKPYEAKWCDFFCYRDAEDDRQVYVNWWKIISLPFFVGSLLFMTFSLVQADKDEVWKPLSTAELFFGGLFGLLGMLSCCCGIKKHGC